jgi:hypothetical protein
MGMLVGEAIEAGPLDQSCLGKAFKGCVRDDSKSINTRHPNMVESAAPMGNLQSCTNGNLARGPHESSMLHTGPLGGVRSAPRVLRRLNARGGWRASPGEGHSRGGDA